MIKNKDIKRIQDLSDKGLSQREIKRVTGKSLGAINNILKRYHSDKQKNLVTSKNIEISQTDKKLIKLNTNEKNINGKYDNNNKILDPRRQQQLNEMKRDLDTIVRENKNLMEKIDEYDKSNDKLKDDSQLNNQNNELNQRFEIYDEKLAYFEKFKNQIEPRINHLEKTTTEVYNINQKPSIESQREISGNMAGILDRESETLFKQKNMLGDSLNLYRKINSIDKELDIKNVLFFGLNFSVAVYQSYKKLNEILTFINPPSRNIK